MSAEFPSTPQKSGFPIWLIAIIGAIVLCLAVVGIAACVMIGGLTLLGPAIGDSFSEIVLTLYCPTESNATEAECEAWATDVTTNHPEVLTDCQGRYSDDGAAMYQCVVDEVGEP